MTSIAELYMLFEYWLHCNRYPHRITLENELIDELSGILVHLIVGMSFVRPELNALTVILIDITTPGLTTCPFSRDDLCQWLSTLDGMKSAYRQI